MGCWPNKRSQLQTSLFDAMFWFKNDLTLVNNENTPTQHQLCNKQGGMMKDREEQKDNYVDKEWQNNNKQ